MISAYMGIEIRHEDVINFLPYINGEQPFTVYPKRNLNIPRVNPENLFVKGSGNHVAVEALNMFLDGYPVGDAMDNTERKKVLMQLSPDEVSFYDAINQFRINNISNVYAALQLLEIVTWPEIRTAKILKRLTKRFTKVIVFYRKAETDRKKIYCVQRMEDISISALNEISKYHVEPD